MSEPGYITPAQAAAAAARAARRQEDRVLRQAPRELLLRLRPHRADQEVRRGARAPGRAEGLHDDRPQAPAGRAQGDRRPPAEPGRPVGGDREHRPDDRAHPGDGLVRRLRRVEVQPRRPGPPPARLDVQGHGADDRAAPGRRHQQDDLRLQAAELHRQADRREDRGQTDDHSYGGNTTIFNGARAVRQHGLRAARPRPRARAGAPDRLRHGHHEPPRRLPGRGPRRPADRRLAAGDGARLRDDRQRRLPLTPIAITKVVFPDGRVDTLARPHAAA